MSKSTTRSIRDEIAALRAMQVPELVARYEGVYGRPPRVKHRGWLWRRIAWKIQEQRFGGLSGAARKQIDTLISEIDVPLGAEDTQPVTRLHRANGEPAIGTTLVRIWRGREILATRTDQGWEHDGVVYRSLSAVARAVTGVRWNGPLFFGLSKRKERGA